jgi:rhodanese-related sulfurtransferase
MIRALCKPGFRVLDFLVKNWLLVFTATVSGGLLLWPLVKGRVGAGSVDVNEAVRLINREKAVLIDVSEPAEYAAGHPNGARHIPLGQLEGSKELPGNKTLPLVVVCPNGARSGRAVALLHKAGYEKAQSLAGGFAAWRTANLPVEKSAA